MDASTIYRIVGQRIKQERNRLGITQAQLSKEVEVSRTSIANMEAGNQNFALDVLYRLAKHLQVTPESLLPTLEEVGEPGKDLLEQYGLDEEEKSLILNAIQKVESE